MGSDPGYTSLIIRNDVGNLMMMESAVKNKKLIFGPEADIAAIERLASLQSAKKQPRKNPLNINLFRKIIDIYRDYTGELYLLSERFYY